MGFLQRGLLITKTTPISLLERLCVPFEPEAWERFVSLYTPLIYTWGRKVGLQEQDATDLVQEVFVKLVQVLPTFTYDAHKGGFRRWLRTVALNIWRDRGKRRSDRPLPGNEAALAELEAPSVSFWETEYSLRLVNRAMALMQADFQPATWKA